MVIQQCRRKLLGTLMIFFLLFYKKTFFNISRKVQEEFDKIQGDKNVFYNNLE